MGDETSGEEENTDSFFNGCRLLQLTSVQLGRFTGAEGVIRVPFKGNKCLEKRENAFFFPANSWICLSKLYVKFMWSSCCTVTCFNQ